MNTAPAQPQETHSNLPKNITLRLSILVFTSLVLTELTGVVLLNIFVVVGVFVLLNPLSTSLLVTLNNIGLSLAFTLGLMFVVGGAVVGFSSLVYYFISKFLSRFILKGIIKSKIILTPPIMLNGTIAIVVFAAILQGVVWDKVFNQAVRPLLTATIIQSLVFLLAFFESKLRIAQKFRINWIYPVVILIIQAIVIVVGYNAYNSGFRFYPSLGSSQQSTIEQAPHLAKKDETAGWKTFKNKYFSFKYPPTWFYESPPWLPADENVSFFVMGAKADHSDGDHKGNEVLISAFGIQGETTIELKKDYYLAAKDTTIAGREAIRVSESRVIISISSDRTVSISSQNLEEILSTFKFLDLI